jgi:hypothetical protein
MCIQRQKALDKQISFNVSFLNIAEDDKEESDKFSPMISCDEHRIM